jgi:hypothetical protein
MVGEECTYKCAEEGGTSQGRDAIKHRLRDQVPPAHTASKGCSVEHRPKVCYVIRRNPPMALPCCLP